MSKPDWKGAPIEANWLAKDASGQWCWYVNEPYLGCYHWMPSAAEVDGDSFYDIDYYFDNDEDWELTLERRP